MFARYKYELRVTIVFEFGQIRDQSNVIAFNSSSGTKNSGILHTNYPTTGGCGQMDTWI